MLKTLRQLSRNFLLGAGLSGLLVFVLLSLSLEMTQMTLAEFGWVKLAIAVLIPWVCGLGAVIFRRQADAMIAAVSRMSETLPF